ncbi:MAG: hypothetical protein Q8P67_05305, partial [archaeon]|nr:hypothetical protein [archaeon]
MASDIGENATPQRSNIDTSHCDDLLRFDEASASPCLRGGACSTQPSHDPFDTPFNGVIETNETTGEKPSWTTPVQNNTLLFSLSPFSADSNPPKFAPLLFEFPHSLLSSEGLNLTEMYGLQASASPGIPERASQMEPSFFKVETPHSPPHSPPLRSPPRSACDTPLSAELELSFDIFQLGLDRRVDEPNTMIFQNEDSAGPVAAETARLISALAQNCSSFDAQQEGGPPLLPPSSLFSQTEATLLTIKDVRIRELEERLAAAEQHNTLAHSQFTQRLAILEAEHQQSLIKYQQQQQQQQQQQDETNSDASQQTDPNQIRLIEQLQETVAFLMATDYRAESIKLAQEKQQLKEKLASHLAVFEEMMGLAEMHDQFSTTMSGSVTTLQRVLEMQREREAVTEAKMSALRQAHAALSLECEALRAGQEEAKALEVELRSRIGELEETAASQRAEMGETSQELEGLRTKTGKGQAKIEVLTRELAELQGIHEDLQAEREQTMGALGEAEYQRDALREEVTSRAGRERSLEEQVGLLTDQREAQRCALTRQEQVISELSEKLQRVAEEVESQARVIDDAMEEQGRLGEVIEQHAERLEGLQAEKEAAQLRCKKAEELAGATQAEVGELTEAVAAEKQGRIQAETVGEKLRAQLSALEEKLWETDAKMQESIAMLSGLRGALVAMQTGREQDQEQAKAVERELVELREAHAQLSEQLQSQVRQAAISEEAEAEQLQRMQEELEECKRGAEARGKEQKLEIEEQKQAIRQSIELIEELQRQLEAQKQRCPRLEEEASSALQLL